MRPASKPGRQLHECRRLVALEDAIGMAAAAPRNISGSLGAQDIKPLSLGKKAGSAFVGTLLAQ
jgi:hypothetical protein